MKLADDVFPSRFAVSLCRACDLLPELESYYFPVWDEVRQLIEFQQMSLVNKFDDCLIVYRETDLSESQLNSLKIIYLITPKLMPGAILKSALNNINVENNKSNPDISSIISNLHVAINQLGKKGVAA